MEYFIEITKLATTSAPSQIEAQRELHISLYFASLLPGIIFYITTQTFFILKDYFNE